MASRSNAANRAFTLVELLVVIGIIGALIAILLPAMATAHAQAVSIQCQSNVRQIVMALEMYAGEYKGRFPQNMSLPAPGQFWYDQERLGEYLFPGSASPAGVVGGCAVCPADENAKRSYAMNIWASSKVDASVSKTFGIQGNLWFSNAKNSAALILVAEKWTTSGSVTNGWITTEPFGCAGTILGQRFGVAGGISPPISAGLFGTANCELPYMRHRIRTGSTGTLPIGRVSIGYADGHVEMKGNDDLGDPVSGKSTLDSWWSPLDPSIN